ncbi:hypothetical protein RN001_011862 [Aquatica leii]|uniref:DUF4771 domain-containing protein n=1 Tax=Aquatica leii TaxID=1421715 RepID=A0AAN7NXV7_9COLE|nr:hypothetical protein RN001_011862 [Aquatica leii]
MGRNSNPTSVVVTAPHKKNLKATNSFLEEKVCDILPTNPKKRPDAFKSMVPPPKTVLDYNINQIDAKLKKAVKMGVAQVHVTQTEASYKHPPPGYVFPEDVTEIKKIQYSTGGPPVWKFEEEKWWEQVLLKQVKSKHNFRALTAENRKFEKMILERDHQRLIKLVGPDWFQELSPQQFDTIDLLKTCILKDKKCKTIIHTQENIKSLGLMNRPKSKHIKMALDNCCECPVEFLLILYQALNGKRTEYSINDRLLLSGVVHLTIKETLKELHIRIPSPPPPLKKKKKPKKKPPKRIKCKCPYLQPFDFVPCPRKHTGVYKNNHIQYPESPYFSYLAELKKESTFKSDKARELYLQKKQSGITLTQHDDILKELKAAEKQYEKLFETEVTNLLKPSIYIPCDHVLLETAPTENGEESIECEDLPVSLESEICVCNVYGEKEPTVSPRTSLSQRSDVIIESRSSSLSTIIEQDSKPQLSKNQEEEEPATSQKISTDCKCKEEAEKNIKKNLNQNIQNDEKEKIGDGKSNTEDKKDDSLDSYKTQCDCLEKYRNRIKLYEKIKQRFMVQHDLMSLPEQYIVGGVTQGPDGQPVYMLSGVVPNYECSCAKMYQEYLEEQERLANMPHLPQGKQKYVVSGVHPTDKGNVFVLAGAVDTEECPCQKLYKSYEQRHTTCLDAYNDYVKKVEVDVVEYAQDIENDNRFDPESLRSLKGSSASDPFRNPSISKECENRLPPISESCEENTPHTQTKPNIAKTTCECGEIHNDEHLTGSFNVCSCMSFPNVCVEPEICECLGEPGVCACDLGPICLCDDEAVEEEEAEEEEEEEVPVRRYTILKEIPCNYRRQVEILQNALTVMAEDGFPLAKLPDSYKLPIFKLWMQMRCGKYWEQEIRRPMHFMSMLHWRHTDHCKGKMKQRAGLGMPPEEAQKYTWARARTVKKIVLAKDTSYYREVKQIAINEAREFFPTTHSYEFPVPVFRDCYFSYLPSKEDACTVWKPWYSHEFKKLRR